MKWFTIFVSLTALALLPQAAGADAAKPFQPSYGIVSISNSQPGGHGNVAQHIALPPSDHLIDELNYSLPAGWDIAKVQMGTDQPVVGSGSLSVDAGCDTTVNTYPLTVLDLGVLDEDPPSVETNWAVQGYPFEQFIFTIEGNSGSGQTIQSFLFTNPFADVCTPLSWDLTFQGMSNDNPPRTVLTNPSSSGVYTWSVQFKSKPPGAGQHTVNRCDQVGIGGSAVPDTDADGIANTCDNCPSTANNDQRDFDADAIGDVCDGDSDGDGVANAGDQCAFTPLSQRPVDAIGCSQAQVDRDLDGICDPGRSSPTWCTGSDNCPMAGNSNQANVVHPATPAGDACEDPDADFRVDAQDNCPDWYNPFQNLPPWTVVANDLDCDGFSAGVEASAGTSPTTHCGVNAWPADINNDNLTDITDIATVGAFFGKSVPPAPARYNIAPDPLDGHVDITDIARLGAFFGKGCL